MKVPINRTKVKNRLNRLNEQCFACILKSKEKQDKQWGYPLLPLFFIGILCVIIICIFSLASREMWVSLDANTKTISLVKNVSGTMTAEISWFQVGAGELRNIDPVLIRIGDKELEVESNELHIIFPDYVELGLVTFSKPILVISEEDSLYDFIAITSDKSSEFYSTLDIKEGTNGSPIELTYNFGRETRYGYYKPGMRWNSKINDCTIELPNNCSIMLKGITVTERVLGIKSKKNTESAKFRLRADNYIKFPRFIKFDFIGVAEALYTFLNEANLTLLKTGEPVKLNFAQCELIFSGIDESRPIKVEVKKDNTASELKVKAWGIANEIEVAGKSLQPNIYQFIYNNFSAISMTLFSAILAWIGSRLVSK